ncbi:endonuclease/exonuclease/phosphatase family protein [Necator americanus]|uniref:sphingomyelin phosphodiesterase n=1 Tax=Necator americanus TaxID=51031 RepID=W2T3S8_NECAM|nr:endonuclease/exonuclease/phosphatase family protein [Necator americanus]ETN75632.1 endonuclease/exonuclease/phosphatase family protein [Necator americanus]
MGIQSLLLMNPEKIPTENGVAYEDLHRSRVPSVGSHSKADSSCGVELRVLTLNVWCLPQPWPIGSKDRKYRLKKLAEAILEENYDIIGLQEVWSENDYLDMVDRLSSTFRFHHYFHSGFTGSGVCVFSRHPIVSTLTHRYSLNGFAHHIHRGDWFGGKVVGLVELEVGEIRVNFYTTHLHAEYDRENDLYLPHRTSQSFELSQFVRHTAHGADIVIVTGDLNMEPEDLGLRTSQSFELSQFVRHTAHGADIVIVTGDLNMEPEDLGLRLILSQVRLFDAWRLAHPSSPGDSVSSNSLSRCRGVDHGATCDRPDNCYSSQKFKDNDESKRIDYILFKSGRMSVCLEKCEITMNKIPEENLNYSDHVGLVAQFSIQNDLRQQSCEWEPNRPLLIEAIGIVSGGQRRARSDRTWFICLAAFLFVQSCEWEPNRPLLIEAIGIVSGGQRRARSDRTWFICLAAFLFVVIALSLFLDPVLPFMSALLSVFRFTLTVVFAFCVWQGLIGLTLERKALKAAKQSMQQLLND